MAERYRSISNLTGETHFSSNAESPIEYSSMLSRSRHVTAFNGGDLVPIYCREVLGGETVDMDMDMQIRMSTMLHPVFGELYADFYAFFVPNRVVNQSWKNVEGENTSSFGIAPDVVLAPLVFSSSGTTQVPVGSVADYYGFPTQAPLQNSVLSQCNDLKFRGYLECYNEFFRDQNYQAIIPYSKLNVFEGFFLSKSSLSSFDGSSKAVQLDNGDSIVSDGSFASGTFIEAVYGKGSSLSSATGDMAIPARYVQWSALDKPLKANKFHDYFTSVLPFVQKGASLSFMFPSEYVDFPLTAGGNPDNYGSFIQLYTSNANFDPAVGQHALFFNANGPSSHLGGLTISEAVTSGQTFQNITGTNLRVPIEEGSLGQLDIEQMRTAVAVQHVYEALARGGSRYHEFVASMFGVNADNPYKDIPTFLGHIRRTLNNYQVAQTSQSEEGASPQGTLAAYSYTVSGGKIIPKHTFLEHGYIHIFAVVRQKNVYSTLLWKDNFRRSFLDFYMPPLANISEQPVRVAEINPFASNAMGNVFGYQEAWAEYRYEPDRVSGLFRSGLSQGLGDWLYLDEFKVTQGVADGSFMTSNAQEAIDPTLAVDSVLNPEALQFLAEFVFNDDKTLPMPVYSVPGLDIF